MHTDATVYPGHLLLLVSVPGGGKSTLIAHLKATHNELSYAVSCTSRPMRPGEVEGEVYYFLSPEEFEARIARDEFLEWIQQDGGRYYGTLKSEITERMAAGEIVVREVEIRGVRAIRSLLSPEDVTVVFITAGSWEDMRERMLARAPMSEEELEYRKQRYEQELQFQTEADFVLENRNGALETAQAKLDDIIAQVTKNTTTV